MIHPFPHLTQQDSHANSAKKNGNHALKKVSKNVSSWDLLPMMEIKLGPSLQCRKSWWNWQMTGRFLLAKRWNHLLLDTSSLFYPTDRKNPAPPWIIETLNHGIRHLSTVARFLPSTVCLVFFFTPLRLLWVWFHGGGPEFWAMQGYLSLGTAKFLVSCRESHGLEGPICLNLYLANKFILKI